MAVTFIANLQEAAKQQQDQQERRVLRKTIEELATGDGRTYRHPDSAQVAYPDTVEKALGDVPPGLTEVAIIGAGAAGIAALYELRQVADANPEHEFRVLVIEVDGSNFLFTPRPQTPKKVTPRRAGRVSSYFAPNTVYEIGAMRFPSIAGLTWHYAQRVFGGNKPVTPFPNPGTVPTEFVFGSRFDHYFGNTWKDAKSPTKIVRDIVLDELVGKRPPAMYTIGTLRPVEVIPKLKDRATPQSELKKIQQNWEKFVKDYEGTTLEAAVRKILEHNITKLPAIRGLTGGQLLDWCVELFGRFGLGTGGFKPLYNMSLAEVMRLLLWEYSNEYTFPPDVAPGNVEFIDGLCKKALLNLPNNFKFSYLRARVSDVFHYDKPRAVGVALYRIETENGREMERSIEIAEFNYAILAMPHDATSAVVSRLSYSAQGINKPEVGDFKRSTSASRTVLPALLLSTRDDAVNARIATAVSTLHMTRSAKTFATIATTAATTDPVPQFTVDDPASIAEPELNLEGQRISAVISDCGLAATYMVPSSTDEENYRTFLVSYTWDDDSTKLQHTFHEWPEHLPPSAGPHIMFDAMLNRAYRQNPVNPTDPNAKWWLCEVLEKAKQDNRVSWDWSTYITAGGFKLDMTGDYYQSNLCFRYHTHAHYDPSRDDERLDSRVFLASCSYSHLGGWLEGAFMSAINAVAGIVVSLNKGNVNKLSSEAQKLFTTFARVIPMV
jgi:hypothetical protein